MLKKQLNIVLTPEGLADYCMAKKEYAGYDALVAALDIESGTELMHQATEELYQQVACRIDSTPMCVKKNLRTLILSCWKRGCRKKWVDLFVEDHEDAPETLYFIDNLAGKLKRKHITTTVR